MATIAAVPTQERTHLTPGQALKIAWACWMGLLAVPALVFLAVMWRLLDDDLTGDVALAQKWFIFTMVYLAIMVPLAFFMRSRDFRDYYQGKVVSPGAYLRGMLTVWLACEIGGLIALIGCLVTGTLLPNLLPALVAFILFTPFWPSGRAMTHPVGNDDDFEIYEEPR
jgi:hypothetical protein